MLLSLRQQHMIIAHERMVRVTRDRTDAPHAVPIALTLTRSLTDDGRRHDEPVCHNVTAILYARQPGGQRVPPGQMSTTAATGAKITRTHGRSSARGGPPQTRRRHEQRTAQKKTARTRTRSENVCDNDNADDGDGDDKDMALATVDQHLRDRNFPATEQRNLQPCAVCKHSCSLFHPHDARVARSCAAEAMLS